MEVPMLVTDFLDRAVRIYPDKVAIVDGDRRFTYREFDERVNRLANALLGLGLSKGDRVCMLSPNSHFYLESFYACAQTGIIIVPLNYRLVAADHEYILNHAGVSAVLVDWEYTGVVDEIRANLPQVKHWVVAKDEGETPDGWQDWNALVDAATDAKPPMPATGENETVSINYTSGTTSRPKGVVMTHRNSYLNAYNMIVHNGMRHEDVELWTLPMFHCNGWGGVFALTGMAGTHVILRAIDGEDILRLIADEGVTFACMAPAVLRTILDTPDKDRFDIRTKPRFTVAGAPPPSAFIERLEKELGWQFMQIYGLTETAPLLTISRPDANTEAEDWARRSRAGVAGIGVDLQVLDDDGQSRRRRMASSVGEICARSNVVFAGYYEQPDQTAEAIYDGYFHTGDLAVWDETESIHIVDRKKDVIISGGENISSPEIEDCLFQHAAVLECAVIGVPHEKWGETPVALIVTREGQNATEEELIAHCRDKMAHFKCPTSIRFVDELPRTATGKLQKYKLREAFWDGDRKVARLSTRGDRNDHPVMTESAGDSHAEIPRARARLLVSYVMALAAGGPRSPSRPSKTRSGCTLAADAVATVVIFGWSMAYDNSSFYDAYWSVIPPAIVLYWMALAEPERARAPHRRGSCSSLRLGRAADLELGARLARARPRGLALRGFPRAVPARLLARQLRRDPLLPDPDRLRRHDLRLARPRHERCPDRRARLARRRRRPRRDRLRVLRGQPAPRLRQRTEAAR